MGEVLCLLGENGAGKSTVIKLLTGVQTPTTGEIYVDGEKVDFGSPRDARDHGIACVFQEVATFPLMSVARNFVVGAEPMKGHGPFRRIDMDKASTIAISEMRKLGIRRVTDGRRLVGSLSAANARHWPSGVPSTSVRVSSSSMSPRPRSASASRRACCA